MGKHLLLLISGMFALTACGTPTSVAPSPPTLPRPTPAVQAATLAPFVPLPADAVWVRTADRIIADGPGARTLDLSQRHFPSSADRVVAAPDGSYIAYPVEQDRLLLLDMRTGAAQILPEDGRGELVGACFAPDSHALAFTVLDQSYSTWQIRTLDLLHGTVRVLREGARPQASGGVVPPLLALNPVAWTPAGLIVEQSGDDPAFSQGLGLALVDPASGALRSLRGEGHLSAIPAPDGTKVALVTGTDLFPDSRHRQASGPPQAAIAVRDLSSGRETVIVPQKQALVPTLRWSPDGSQLLYAETPDYDMPIDALHVLRADGSGVQTIAIGAAGVPGALRDAAWRDNATLLLLVADANQQLHLYALPMGALSPAGLNELGVFDGRAAAGRVDQILYVPR